MDQHRCQHCGGSTCPETYCMDCQKPAQQLGPRRRRALLYQILESAELDLENGVINEGEYLEICDLLKNN